MVTFTIVARQLGAQFVHLYALVRQAMVRRNVKYAAFEESVARLGGASLYDSAGSAVNSSGDLSFGLDELGTDGAALSPRELLGVDPDTFSTVTASAVGGPGYRLPMNQHHLQNAWDVTQRSTAEDWNEWIQRFTVELLRESPSPALRACNALARVLPSLARELFHAAFVSCWFELPDDYQANLVMSLERAFQSDSIPPEILQTLLNLAEFMEIANMPLPIDGRRLGALAERSQAYAKALRYKEREFLTAPAESIEALISINQQLQHPEAAEGILTYSQHQHQAKRRGRSIASLFVFSIQQSPDPHPTPIHQARSIHTLMNLTRLQPTRVFLHCFSVLFISFIRWRLSSIGQTAYHC